MALSILQNLFEANVALTLLLLVYLVFLRKLTHFDWSRVYLVLTPLVSLSIGLINIEVEHVVSVSSQINALSLSELFPDTGAGEFEVLKDGNIGWLSKLWNHWPSLISWLILLGSAVTLIQLIVQWFALRTSLTKHSLYVDSLGVYRNNRFQTAFVFLNRIYVPDTLLSLPRQELNRIISHEKAHIRFKHGRDNALVAIIKALFWYNPLFWFLQREIQLIHEFQADEVCSKRDTHAEYPSLLLKLSAPGLTSSFIHPFSKNLIKKRVTKLNQLKSPIMKKVLFLLAVPVCGALFFAFSVKHVQKTVVTADEGVSLTAEYRPFAIPMDVSVITKVSPFGMRKTPFDEVRKMHNGLDLVAPMNVAIYAAADGVISKAENNEAGFGNNITIEHNEGLVTRYAHLISLNVSPGERVNKGDIIGYNGSTGKSTGPHLHFEVLQDGVHVNPELYIDVSGILTNDNSLKVNRDKLVIVIDAGHGGDDPGNNDHSISEKELTLEYAQALSDKLRASNYHVKMVRTGDQAVGLQQRTDFANNEKEALFISLHLNQSENKDASGFEIYVPKEHSNRQLKSNHFGTIVNKLLEENNIQTRGVQSAPYWVLKKSECPAVMFELGFLSSESDLQKLKTESYRDQLVGLIANGVDLYAQ